MEGWLRGGCPGDLAVRSPAGEAVGCRHYPAGVDEAPSTETVPNVDGGQPGV